MGQPGPAKDQDDVDGEDCDGAGEQDHGRKKRCALGQISGEVDDAGGYETDREHPELGDRRAGVLRLRLITSLASS